MRSGQVRGGSLGRTAATSSHAKPPSPPSPPSTSWPWPTYAGHVAQAGDSQGEYDCPTRREGVRPVNVCIICTTTFDEERGL